MTTCKAAIAWRGVRAEALAIRGDDAAGDRAGEGRGRDRGDDGCLARSRRRPAPRSALALRTAGSDAEADGEEARALELWEAKGATLLVVRAGSAPRRIPEAIAPVSPLTLPDAMTSNQRALTIAFGNAVASRDWDALVDALSPDLEVYDHRRLGWEPLRGPQAYVDALRALVDLAPDVRLRLDRILEVADHAVLYSTAWEGTRDGGSFEEPSLIVAELDDAGRIRRFDQYDHTAEAIARERFAHAAMSGAALAEPNLATVAMDRVQDAFHARDWSAMRAACAPHVITEDRRRHVLVGGDLDFWIDDWRRIAADDDAWFGRRLVARVGDRIVLEHVHWTIRGVDEGGADIDYLLLAEVDAAGRVVAVIAFDPDDHAAAQEEADRRLRAGSDPPP